MKEQRWYQRPEQMDIDAWDYPVPWKEIVRNKVPVGVVIFRRGGTYWLNIYIPYKGWLYDCYTEVIPLETLNLEEAKAKALLFL